MESILFIVEGKKEEPLIIKTLISKFFKKRINTIISYDTNIHQLYKDLFADDDIDIISLLKKQGKLEDLPVRFDQIAEKYLFFDLDPHDPVFDFGDVAKLVNFFNNETENGKLYINYPFSEALYEYLDSSFVTKRVKITKCKTYKKDLKKNFVNHSVIKPTYENLIQKFSHALSRRGIDDMQKIPNKWKNLWYYRISLQEWKNVIRQHIDKAISLTKNNGNDDLHRMIFDVQVLRKNTDGHIYILSIYGIFIYEYFKDWESL